MQYLGKFFHYPKNWAYKILLEKDSNAWHFLITFAKSFSNKILRFTREENVDHIQPPPEILSKTTNWEQQMRSIPETSYRDFIHVS